MSNPFHNKDSDLFAPLNASELIATFNKIGGKDGIVPLETVPEDAPPPPTHHFQLGEAVASYEYRDVDGRLRCRTVRFENGGKKAVLPQSWVQFPNGGFGWAYKAPTGQRPLYNAHLLASRPNDRILLCEGEKTADAAAKLFPDMIAVTTLGGSSSPHLTDMSPFGGRRVVIAPDNDEPGFKYARTFFELLTAAGVKEISILRPERLGGKEAKKGWDLADALDEGWTAEKLAEAGNLFEPFNPTANDNAPALPRRRRPFDYPFALVDDGVEHIRRTEDGEEIRQFICTPIRILGLARDIEGRNWSRVIEALDDDDKWHQVTIPMTAVAGDPKVLMELLVDHGVTISSDRHAKAAIRDYIAHAPTDVRIRFIDATGWTDDYSAFVLPHRIFGGSEGERILFRGKSHTPMMTSVGTIEAWLSLAKLAEGNSRLVLALSAALLGPLLPLVHAEGGGFHIVGGSSIGKSTTMYLSAAFWGIVLGSWRTTDNALEASAARHNHLAMILDELSQASAHAADAIAYMLANGKGKGRASQTGDARPTREWLAVYLSTGEETLEDKLAQSGRKLKAGQEVRTLNVPAKVPNGYGIYETIHGFASGAELSEHIKEAAKAVQGVAGEMYLQELVKAPRQIADCVIAAADDFVAEHCPPSADGQVKRAAKRFALAAAAGELGISLGLLPWPQGEAFRGVAKCFQDWIAERGGVGAAEDREAIETVMHFIAIHGMSHFDHWTDNPCETSEVVYDKARDRMGWRRLVDGKWEYFATAEGFREICGGKKKAAEYAKALIAAGILKPANDGKSSVSKTIPQHGKQRVYHIVPPSEDDADA